MGNQASTIAQYNQQRLTTMGYVLVGVIGAVFLGLIVAFTVSACSKAHTETLENRARMEAQRNRTNHQADMLMLEVLQQQQPPPPAQPPPPQQAVILAPQPTTQPVMLLTPQQQTSPYYIHPPQQQ